MKRTELLVAIVDGQGGGIGRALVERIRSGRGDKPGEDKVNDDIVINIDAEKDKENIQAEERMDSNG